MWHSLAGVLINDNEHCEVGENSIGGAAIWRMPAPIIGSQHSRGQHMLTQLMWELLTEDGHWSADALEHRHGEGGTNGQAIDEVVEAIA